MNYGNSAKKKKTISISAILLSTVILIIIGFLVFGSRKLNTSGFNQQKEWGNIHEFFEKFPSWVKEWEGAGYNCEEAQEWISAGINPWEILFLFWLTKVKKIVEPEISPTWWVAKNDDYKRELKKEWRKKMAENISNNNISLSDLKEAIEDFCWVPMLFESAVSFEEGEEIIKFTELSQYEEFLQKKGENWEYYEAMEIFLRKWKKIENDN